MRTTTWVAVFAAGLAWLGFTNPAAGDEPGAAVPGLAEPMRSGHYKAMTLVRLPVGTQAVAHASPPSGTNVLLAPAWNNAPTPPGSTRPPTNAALASITNDLPVGQTVAVTGHVARVERDGLSANSLIVVLEGNLYCRLAWVNVDKARKSLRLLEEPGGHMVALWNKKPMFSPGERIGVRGVCRHEMSRVVLDQARVESLGISAARPAWSP